MRKSFLIVLFLVSGLSLQAQLPYRHSVGGVFCTTWGFSYKTFWAEKLSFSADVGCHIIRTGGEVWPDCTVSSIILNPNLMYETPVSARLYALVGGGVTLGYNWKYVIWHIAMQGITSDNYKYLGKGGKLGANVIAGLEYVFKIPLAVQLDFRPGYGVFIKDNVRWHHFDWNVCLSMRYVL